MKSNLRKIALVTPLKDEINNVERLLGSIKAQSQSIYVWVIVENGSTDGSKEYLKKIINLPNVENFVVLNFSLPNDTYELGVKYSTVVSQGFNHIKLKVKTGEIEAPNFIGICDADCFPKNNYFEQLAKYMEASNIDISSGLGVFEDGKPDGEAHDWVRGNCRLWNWKCFMDSGYLVGPSADTLSLGKAQLRGYTAKPNHELKYICREMGQRTRYDYYGYSSYFRGITPLYAILKFFNYFAVGQGKQGYAYLRGYFHSAFKGKEKLDDPDLRKYFSETLKRKIDGFFNKSEEK